MAKNNKSTIIKEGIITSNPLFVQLLGCCPALAITTSIMNAVGMFIAFLFVLLLSNITISALRKLIPDEIRIPVYIVIVATFVTCVSLLMQAFTPELYSALSSFVNLIVVNCIILGRAEAFASKNNPLASICDAIGQALGYGAALFVISFIRELIGKQSITLSNPFNAEQSITLHLLDGSMGGNSYAINFFVTSAGAFITMALILAVINTIKSKKGAK